MRLGKLLSVGEVSDQAPVEEPAAPVPVPQRDARDEAPAAVHAGR